MTVTMKIEIPKGSIEKYEIDKETGEVRFDRYSKLAYPFTYGYIKGTLAEDGDPLDAFLLSPTPLVPGCIVEVEIHGMVKMIDNGEPDHKLIVQIPGEAVVLSEVEIIKDFLAKYKDGTKVGKFVQYRPAEKYLKFCQEAL